jgi:hypothetical protein
MGHSARAWELSNGRRSSRARTRAEMGLGRSSSLSAIVTPHPPRSPAKTVTVGGPTLPGQGTHIVEDSAGPKVSSVQVMDRGVGLCEGQSCSTRPDCDPSGRAAPQPSVCPARGASWLQPSRHTSARSSMNTILPRQTGEFRSADGAVRRPTTQRDCTTVRSKVNWPDPPIGWPPSLDWWTLSVLGSPA